MEFVSQNYPTGIFRISRCCTMSRVTAKGYILVEIPQDFPRIIVGCHFYAQK